MVYYFCRGLEELDSLEREFQYDAKGAMKHANGILEVYKECLKYPLYKAITFVLLWKLFSVIPCYQADDSNSDDLDSYDANSDVFNSVSLCPV